MTRDHVHNAVQAVALDLEELVEGSRLVDGHLASIVPP
jgi:hypothetical protein